MPKTLRKFRGNAQKRTLNLVEELSKKKVILEIDLKGITMREKFIVDKSQRTLHSKQDTEG